MNARVVYIALGSNLGDRASNLLRAFDQLQAFADGSVQRSSLWESEPVNCPPGSPKFLNAAAAFKAKAGETPETLLDQLKHLERLFGRVPKQILNESRPLDLDLIAFGEEVRSGPELVLPHPRAHLRGFVLAPLCEINPGLRLPGVHLTVQDLLRRLPPDEHLPRLAEPRH